jgi:two-component system sensor histidine kinase DesK
MSALPAANYPQWIVRRTPLLLLALHLPVMAMPLLLVTTGGEFPHTHAQMVLAVIAAPIMGALHLRHILAAARGRRPAGWPWTLAAQAALVFGPMVWIGVDWVSSELPLIASTMLLLPGKRGPVIGFAVPVAVGAAFYTDQLLLHIHGRQLVTECIYFPIIFTTFGLALYGTVRLARVVRELDATRDELARLAVDQERLRVSRDLHDVLGQSLSAISLKGDLALRLLNIDANRARGEVLGMTDVARTALRNVRAVARDEHNVTLREELTAAAALLAAAGVDATITAPDTDRTLPLGSAEVLAWAVREGTTNLLRHSDARIASITLAVRDNGVELEMINDGERECPSGQGTGIAGLRDRAEALGGSTIAGVAPGGGFRLSVTVPAGEGR